MKKEPNLRKRCSKFGWRLVVIAACWRWCAKGIVMAYQVKFYVPGGGAGKTIDLADILLFKQADTKNTPFLWVIGDFTWVANFSLSLPCVLFHSFRFYISPLR